MENMHIDVRLERVEMDKEVCGNQDNLQKHYQKWGQLIDHKFKVVYWLFTYSQLFLAYSKSYMVTSFLPSCT